MRYNIDMDNEAPRNWAPRPPFMHRDTLLTKVAERIVYELAELPPGPLRQEETAEIEKTYSPLDGEKSFAKE